MKAKRVKPAIPDVIAERVFERSDGRQVRVEVGRPHQAKQGAWACEFRVLAVGHSKVYSLPGEDSLGALQMALAMMAVQIDSYKEQHGLTFLGGSSLLVMRPDFDALKREVEADPEYPLWSHALDGIFEEERA